MILIYHDKALMVPPLCFTDYLKRSFLNPLIASGKYILVL